MCVCARAPASVSVCVGYVCETGGGGGGCVRAGTERSMGVYMRPTLPELRFEPVTPGSPVHHNNNVTDQQLDQRPYVSVQRTLTDTRAIAHYDAVKTRLAVNSSSCRQGTAFIAVAGRTKG